MPELPVVSGREARQAFERLGWIFRRQTGSHIILTKPESMAFLRHPDGQVLDLAHRPEIGLTVERAPRPAQEP